MRTFALETRVPSVKLNAAGLATRNYRWKGLVSMTTLSRNLPCIEDIDCRPVLSPQIILRRLRY